MAKPLEQAAIAKQPGGQAHGVERKGSWDVATQPPPGLLPRNALSDSQIRGVERREGSVGLLRQVQE